MLSSGAFSGCGPWCLLLSAPGLSHVTAYVSWLFCRLMGTLGALLMYNLTSHTHIPSALWDPPLDAARHRSSQCACEGSLR